jgi:hypothetical protein
MHTLELERFDAICEIVAVAHFAATARPGGAPFVDVEARLFRTGTHKGRAYTEKDLADVVNRFRAPAGERDWQVPVQLDHSESANDTVGHVRSLKLVQDPKLRETVLQGTLRFVGSRNVERVQDGRFKRLSVAFPLDLRDVTVFERIRTATRANKRPCQHTPSSRRRSGNAAPW